MTISYHFARARWAPDTVLSASAPSILPWKEVTSPFLASWDSGNPRSSPNVHCSYVAAEVQRGDRAYARSHDQRVVHLELGPRPFLCFGGTLWLIDVSTLPSSLGLWPTFLPALRPRCQWWGRSPLQLALAGKSNASGALSHHGLCTLFWLQGIQSWPQCFTYGVLFSFQSPGDSWTVDFTWKSCPPDP